MKLVMAKEGYRKVGDKYLLAKKCTKCGRWLVANTDKFYRNKITKCGLESQCKECKKKYDKQWQQANRSRKAKNNKQWYENNKDSILEYQKQWQQANRDRKNEYDKQWYQNNRDKVLEQRKQYRQSPQGQVVRFNSSQRRRAKEEQQGAGITKDQWLEMMNFFGWRCAYSGEYLGGNDNSFNRTIDHIVSLNSGGDNMIWNCVPMLRSLNSSKHTNNMEEWYKEQECYDPKRLQKIYEWQEYAYNKWGKDTQYFNSGNIQIKLI